MLSFTTYLIDLDGVIYRGNALLPGAREFVELLQEHNKKFLFLTNNSFASETQVLEKLERIGIAVYETHLLCAGQVVVRKRARRFPAALVYVEGERPVIVLVQQHHLMVAPL